MNIPYGKHEVSDEDISNVIEVLRNKNLTQGNEIVLFEESIKKYVGCSEAIAVNSATSALHIACIALGLGPGDWMWTTPITFVASANCAVYCGSKVDFVDIDEKTGLIDCEKLLKKLKNARENDNLPKVIIAVHLTGASCDMKRLYELSLEYGFKIIEDASHAIGGRYKDTMVGSCVYSDITVFSFHPVKIITTGEGGMAMTNDTQLARKLRLARSHGIARPTKDSEKKEKGEWFYEQIELGYNYRMNDIEASLGRSQLKRIDEFIEKRSKIRDEYEKHFMNAENLSLLNIPENVKSSHHLVVIQLNENIRHKYKKIFHELRNEGIGVQLHYMPVHLHPFYKELGFMDGNFPCAESYSRRSMSIPIYTTLKKEELSYVIETIKKVVK